MEHTCYDEDGTYSPANCKPVSEMWRGCQEPQYVDYLKDSPKDPNPGDGVWMTIFHPSWGYFGACDKISCQGPNCGDLGMINPRQNYRCGDKDENGERAPGSNIFEVCDPARTKCARVNY